MNRIFNWGILISVFWGILCPVLVNADMSSSSYKIPTHTFSSSGSDIVSEFYTILGVLGQATPVLVPAPPSSSDSYAHFPGFIYTLETGLVDCTLSRFVMIFGKDNASSNDCCDIDFDGDVDGEDLFLILHSIE